MMRDRKSLRWAGAWTALLALMALGTGNASATGIDMIDVMEFRLKEHVVRARLGGDMRNVSPEAYRREMCAMNYPGYDPVTNQFRGRDGRLHPCQ